MGQVPGGEAEELAGDVHHPVGGREEEEDGKQFRLFHLLPILTTEVCSCGSLRWDSAWLVT